MQQAHAGAARVDRAGGLGGPEVTVARQLAAHATGLALALPGLAMAADHELRLVVNELAGKRYLNRW